MVDSIRLGVEHSQTEVPRVGRRISVNYGAVLVDRD